MASIKQDTVTTNLSILFVYNVYYQYTAVVSSKWKYVATQQRKKVGLFVSRQHKQKQEMTVWVGSLHQCQ